jgi:hypothetical protein
MTACPRREGVRVKRREENEGMYEGCLTFWPPKKKKKKEREKRKLLT